MLKKCAVSCAEPNPGSGWVMVTVGHFNPGTCQAASLGVFLLLLLFCLFYFYFCCIFIISLSFFFLRIPGSQFFELRVTSSFFLEICRVTCEKEKCDSFQPTVYLLSWNKHVVAVGVASMSSDTLLMGKVSLPPMANSSSFCWPIAYMGDKTWHITIMDLPPGKSM